MNNNLSQERICELYDKKQEFSIRYEDLKDEAFFIKALETVDELIEHEANRGIELSKKDLIKLCVAMTGMVKMPLVSCAAMYSGIANKYLEDSIKAQRIVFVAELIIKLAHTGLYTLDQNNYGQFYVTTKYYNHEAELKIKKLMVLPPLVERPNIILDNKDSFTPYMEEESLILGVQQNHHEKPINLHTINQLTQTPIYVDFEIGRPIKPEKVEKADWENYLNQLDEIEEITKDREVYLPYKYDKRGRIYCTGYHVDTQGDSFKKAQILLKPTHIPLN